MKHLLDAWDTILETLHRKQFLIFLDYDGTLAPIVSIPHKARMSKGMKNVLRRLSENKNCRIAIISGRSLNNLKNRVGLQNITYAGCHGFELEGTALGKQHLVSSRWRGFLRQLYGDLRRNLCRVKGTLVEYKGISISVHYRLVSRKNLPFVHRVLEDLTRKHTALNDLQIIPAKKVIEIMPPARWDKGKCVSRIISNLKPGRLYRKFIPVYIGDDVTDEDAFKVLRNKGLTVFVGKPGRTAAKYYLQDTGEVLRFLQRIDKAV